MKVPNPGHVPAALHDSHAVKELEKQYIWARMAKVGTPSPRIVGIEEVSIRERHTYRIVVSDLVRRREHAKSSGVSRSERLLGSVVLWSEVGIDLPGARQPTRRALWASAWTVGGQWFV